MPSHQERVRRNYVIDSVVAIVSVAEILAPTMDMKTSAAVRMILKSWQLMHRLQSGRQDSILAAMQAMGSKPA